MACTLLFRSFGYKHPDKTRLPQNYSALQFTHTALPFTALFIDGAAEYHEKHNNSRYEHTHVSKDDTAIFSNRF